MGFSDVRDLRAAPVALLALGALGCGRDPVAPSGAAAGRVDPAWVTGEAARGVDPATARFGLPTPATRYVGRLAAESLAVAVARWYGSANTVVLGGGPEQDRGGPITYNALQPCERATYVEGPIGELPPAFPGWARRSLAAKWAAPLCAPGVPGAQLSVGVPDAPREVQVAGTTLVAPRRFGGGADFSAIGVPARFPSGLPLTPEAAVAYAVGATGRRVAAVPVPYDQWAGPAGNYPLCASWQLTLEGPARLVGDSTPRAYDATTVYVRPPGACFGGGARLYVALPDQPATQGFPLPRDTTGQVADPGYDLAPAPVVRPLRFEAVTPAR